MIRTIVRCYIRVLRFVLDLTTAFVFRILYGQPEILPPITEGILLHPATTLAEKIRKKEVTSVEVVEAVIRRIKDVQPYINAVVDNAFAEAIVEAKRVDELVASGTKSEEEMKHVTPLLGVPFSCKEQIAVKGMYFTNGLYSRRGQVADYDAGVVKKLKRAGAILVAKTNISELSLWWDCGNCIYGSTKNPYDTRRTPGGSSGGEGALIGSGASIIGIGSDIGGSLRIPAFMNGIFAHKPSAGLLPNTDTYPPLPDSIANFYSCMGPLCRYASDLRPMMEILAVRGKINLHLPVKFHELKVYYSEDDGGNPFITPVRHDIKTALRQAVRYFEEKYGVHAKLVHLDGLEQSARMWLHVLAEAGLPPTEVALSAGKDNFNLHLELLKWCMGISNHTAPALMMALSRRHLPGKDSETRISKLKKFEQLRAEFDELLKENCVFFYPTQPEPAPYLRETIPKFNNPSYTTIFNLLGYPATHVPLGLSKGLPIGIQVVANYLKDHLTIAVAEELEKRFGGWTSPVPFS